MKAQARGDESLVLDSLMARATLRLTPNQLNDPLEGYALLEQARPIAARIGDPETEAWILWTLALHAMMTGQPIETQVHLIEKGAMDLIAQNAFQYNSLIP